MSVEAKGLEFTPMGVKRLRTDIDRRECKRVVPMKVLGLGFGRTGTSSLRTAFYQLGIADAYHMIEMIYENPRDADLWLEAYEAKFEGKGKPYGREEFDKLLGHCMAVTDWPPVSFSEELIEAYPDAKVVLTVRDNVDAWYKSVITTIGNGAVIFKPPVTFSQWLLQRIMPRPSFYRTMQKVIEHSCLSDLPRLGKKGYLEHNERIKALVPPERLLVFNIKEGWAPLCKFLDLPVPETPFPRVNESKTWLETVANSRRAMIKQMLFKWLKTATIVGVLAVVAYLGLKKYRS